MIEGSTLGGTVLSQKYKYYRFFDTQPTLDTMLDLQTVSGDPDLYVSCRVNPTNDDSGTPSRLHYNFSSAFYGEDTLWIKPSDR